MDKGTAIRTIALAITWLNVLLNQQGLETVPVLNQEEIALGLTFVASVWGWFKNNYITVKGREQKKAIEKAGAK